MQNVFQIILADGGRLELNVEKHEIFLFLEGGWKTFSH